MSTHIDCLRPRSSTSTLLGEEHDFIAEITERSKCGNHNCSEEEMSRIDRIHCREIRLLEISVDAPLTVEAARDMGALLREIMGPRTPNPKLLPMTEGVRAVTEGVRAVWVPDPAPNPNIVIDMFGDGRFLASCRPNSELMDYQRSVELGFSDADRDRNLKYMTESSIDSSRRWDAVLRLRKWIEEIADEA